MVLTAAAFSAGPVNVQALVPLAVAGVALYLLHRRGLKTWHAVICVLAGVIIAGSVIGPDISSLLSQVSGGFLP